MLNITGQHGGARARDYNRRVWPMSHYSLPPVPEFFRKGLFHKFGQNPHGEGNYRVISGMEARQFSNGNPNAIKYPNPNNSEIGWACYMLERWAPPEFFNKEEWERLRFGEFTTSGYIDHLGPWRTKGSWILVAPLATERDGMPDEMLPLTEKVLEELYSRLSRGAVSVNERLAEMELQRQIRKSKAQKTLRKLLDDNFEYYRLNEEKINAEASRKGVLVNRELSFDKSTLNAARKLLVPEGVTNEHTARTSA